MLRVGKLEYGVEIGDDGGEDHEGEAGRRVGRIMGKSKHQLLFTHMQKAILLVF